MDEQGEKIKGERNPKGRGREWGWQVGRAWHNSACAQSLSFYYGARLGIFK